MSDLVLKKIPYVNEFGSERAVNLVLPVLNAFGPTRKIASVASGVFLAYEAWQKPSKENFKKLAFSVGLGAVSYLAPKWESTAVLALQLHRFQSGLNWGVLREATPVLLPLLRSHIPVEALTGLTSMTGEGFVRGLGALLKMNPRMILAASLLVRMGLDVWSLSQEKEWPEKLRDGVLIAIRGYQVHQNLKPVKVVTQKELEELLPKKAEEEKRDRTGEIYLENLGNFFEEAKPWITWLQKEETKFVPPLPSISVAKEPKRGSTSNEEINYFFQLKKSNHQYTECSIGPRDYDSSDSGFHFKNVVFKKCLFRKYNLSETTFEQCRFVDSTFKKMQFKNSKFVDSWFRGCVFEKCHFPYTSFLNTGLVNCKVTDSSFFKTVASETYLLATTIKKSLFAGQAGFKFGYGSDVPTRKPMIGLRGDGREWRQATDGEIEVDTFSYSKLWPEVDEGTLKQEVEEALLSFDSESKTRALSLSALILNRAAPGSEVDKLRQRARDIVQNVDGITLPGGSGIAPQLYGQERDEKNKEDYVDYAGDLFEMALVLEAFWRNVPLWGTCRGNQLINVALGGTLNQYIEGQQREQPIEIKGDHPAQKALQKAVGPLVYGSSRHTQAVDKVGDGLIKAAEYKGVTKGLLSANGHALGTQFHPEFHFEPPEDDDEDDVEVACQLVSDDLEYLRAKKGSPEEEKMLTEFLSRFQKYKDLREKIAKEAAVPNKGFFTYFKGLVKGNFAKRNQGKTEA